MIGMNLIGNDILDADKELLYNDVGLKDVGQKRN